MAESIRILHVDDDPDFAYLTADFLEREDERFDVIVDTRPGDALRRLDEEPVDCVVSDYDMPELNGLDFLKEVQTEHPELPFVLFTGKGSEEIASEAISAGVTDYLQKGKGTSQYEVLANRIGNAVEKRRAERSLHRREERLEALLEHARESITILVDGGEVSYCSPSVERNFGYDPGALVGSEFGEFVHPRDRESLEAAMRRATSRPESIQPIEFRFGHEDGSWRWVEAVANHRGDDPLIQGTVLNWRDVTEQRTYERELEETNELLEAVIDASPAAILSYDREGRVQLWNPAAEDIYGWSADEVMGEPLPMIPEGKEDEYLELLEQILDGEVITNLELRRETKAGVMIDISLSTAPVEDPDGAVIGNVSVAQDITERKNREAELEAIRQRTELALAGTDSIIWERDVVADTFTRHGPIEEVYGETEAGVGETMEDFYRMVHPDDREAVEAAMQEAVEIGSEYDVEYRIQADGKTRWFRTRASVRRADDGAVVRVVGLATDITELKRRAEELQRYETIIEALGDPVYALDADGYYTFVNDAYLEQTGYAREEILGTHVSEIVSETDLRRGREHVRKLLAEDGRRTVTWEVERLTADGERFPCEHHMALLPLDENGDPQGTAGVVRDISGRKEREERLEEATDRMQLALQGANSWIWDWDLEKGTATQTAVTDILGVDEETVTRDIGDFVDQIHPDDRDAFLEEKERAVAEGGGYHSEFRLEIEGAVRWIESRGEVHRDEFGDPERLIGIATDVTEQKERALERRWMQRALDQSSEAVLVSDPETAEIEYVNDTACDQLGYGREQLLEMTILDIQPHLSDTQEWEEHVERLRAEGHDLFEGVHVRSDGVQFPVEVNTGLVEFDRQEYLLGIARDITHRKQREEELQRQIDRLDEFTRIVSHDLRNPLNVATGRLRLLSEECDSQHLDGIEASLDRMQTLIDDLLTLAREGHSGVDTETIELAEFSETCWKTVETDRAELRTTTEETIRADRNRLRQLLENLFTNAVEHGSTDVIVTVGVTDDGDGFFVEDDGGGIPESERERVFETGYTTNEGGTGFGLAIVSKVAAAHDWTVDLKTGRYGGARFEFGDVAVGD